MREKPPPRIDPGTGALAAWPPAASRSGFPALGGLGAPVLGALIALSNVGCDPDGARTAEGRPGTAQVGARTTQDFASPEPPVTWLRADGLEWTQPSLPGFAPGARIAVLYGDPLEAGPYVLRARFPDGYRFPAHLHHRDELITVISGTLLLAAGERFNAVLLRAHETGDFLLAPAGTPHYGGAEGETVVQLHGIGPYEATVVDPYVPEAGG